VTFFGYVFLAVYVLYMDRDLGLGPSAIGLVFSIGGAGALAGAILAGPLARRVGIGPAIIWSRVAFAVGGIPVPLAVLVPGAALPLLIVSEFAQWMALTIATVNQLTVRQSMVPDRLLGRASATIRFVVTGSQPLGSLLGGLLGQLLGLRAALLIGIIGSGAAFVWVLWSPLRRMIEPPPPLEPEPAATAAPPAGTSGERAAAPGSSGGASSA
jgi:MFS family permease